MDIILSIPYILLFVFLIYKFKFFNIRGLKKYQLSVLFFLKVMTGFFLLFIYTHYYKTHSSADVFNYFDDGNILYSALHQNPADYFQMLTGIGADKAHLMKYYNEMRFWIKEFDYNLYNDNRTIIRLNAIIRLFSFGSIYVHTVFFAFFSFIGLTAIYKIFSNLLSSKKWLLIIAVYLIPTVLFWTSGVLKEAILMFGFGIYLLSVLKLLETPYKIKFYVFLVFSIWLLLLLKFYVLIASIPGILTIILLRFTSKKQRLLKFLVMHVLVFILLINSQLIFKNYSFLDILANKQHDFIAYVESLNNVGSKIDIPILEPTVVSLIKNTPVALANTIFRPFIWEANSSVSLLAAFENLIFILFILFALFFKRKDYKMNEIIYFSVSFTFILFLLSGLTTPVLGALVRYKAPALPFFAIIFIDILDIERIKNFKLKYYETSS